MYAYTYIHTYTYLRTYIPRPCIHIHIYIYIHAYFKHANAHTNIHRHIRTYILALQKIRHYGPHIYSIAVFHVFRLFEILTNIRRAHDVVIFMCIFITRIHVRIPIHVHKQQWLWHIQNFCFNCRHGYRAGGLTHFLAGFTSWLV